jgi:hypothetical protein
MTLLVLDNGPIDLGFLISVIAHHLFMASYCVHNYLEITPLHLLGKGT